MYNVDAIAAYDQQKVAEIKERQGYIQAAGQAAGLTITDVRTYRVLMPWRGTKRWDGSAERFSFAAFAFPYKIPYRIIWGNGAMPMSLHGLDAHYATHLDALG